MLNNINDVKHNDIDEIINQTTNIFVDTARHLDMVKLKRNNKQIKRQNNKPWFNTECRKKRKIFYKAKQKDTGNGRDHITTRERKNAAKIYKKTVRKSIKKYQNDLASMLRSLNCKDPKKYWNYIRSDKKNNKTEKQPNCTEFANTFKKLGTTVNEDNNNYQMNVNFLNYIDVFMY